MKEERVNYVRGATCITSTSALILAVASFATAWADVTQGGGGITSGSYYVQHVSSGKCIAAGHNWDTRGIVSGGGLDWTLAVAENDGSYSVTFYSGIGSTANKSLGSNLFVDSTAYSFTVQATDGGYTIGNGTQYLYVDGNDELQLGDSGDTWQFVTRDDLIASLSNASVANPMDVTFLMPGANFGRFDPRVGESWKISDDCTNTNLYGGASGTADKCNQCAESYHTTFDIYQTIAGAPAGTYALNVQGFYRSDGNGDAPVFYVGTSSSGVPLRTGSENNMTAASQAFQAGLYRLEKPVLFYYDGTAESFNVGVKCNSNQKWVIFDNFQLEYLGAGNVNPIFVDGTTASYSTSELGGKQITIKNGGKILVSGVTLDFTNTDEVELFEVAGISVDGAALEDGADLSAIVAVDEAAVQCATFLSDNKVVARPTVVEDGVYYVQEASSGMYMAAGFDYGTRGRVNATGMELKLTVVEGTDSVIFDSYPDSGISDHYLGEGLYMDQAKCVFTLAKAEQGLTISRNGQYVYVDNDSKLAFGNTPSYWTLVSAQTRNEQNLDSLSSATKDNGVNATFLIHNPSFEQSETRFAKSWTITAANNNLCGGNGDNHCAESYKSSNGISLSQTLVGAPAGTYALTAQGFYRQESGTTDSGTLPHFFIGSATAAFPARSGSENSMNDASSSFSAGKYTIAPLYFYYDGKGDLTVGVSYGFADKWIIFDNFQLTFYGADDVTPPTPGKYYIQYAEEGDYNGKFMAAGNNWGTHGIVNTTGLDFTIATMNGVRTVSLDSNVSNGGDKHYLGSDCFVDALATGFTVDSVENGCRTIKYGDKYLSVVNGQLELVDTAAKWRLVTPDARKATLAGATKSSPVDATFLIPGANFGRNDGRVSSWTGAYTAGGDNTNYCADNNETAFDLYQTITDAPAGLYALTAQGFYAGAGDDVPVFYIGISTIDFTARAASDDESVTDKSKASAKFSGGNYSTGPVYYYYNGNSEGFKVGAKYTGTDKWVVFDNFQLKYMGQVLAHDADGEYYATIAHAVAGVAGKNDKTVTVVADTDENVVLTVGCRLVVSDGVNFTGTVSANAETIGIKQTGSTYEAVDNSTSSWICAEATGSWATAANWSTGVIPSASTAVTFPAKEEAGEIGVTVSGEVAAKSIAIGANATVKFTYTGEWGQVTLSEGVSGDGALTLVGIGLKNAGSTSASATTIYVDANGASLSGDWTVERVVAYGQLNVYNDTTITAADLMASEANLNRGGDVVRNLSIGDIMVATGCTPSIWGGTWTFSGTVTLSGEGATLSIPGSAVTTSLALGPNTSWEDPEAKTKLVYAISGGTIDPAGGTSTTVVSAENEEAAVAAVTVVVPAAVSGTLAPADYKAYFKLKATETGESGKFTVEVEDFADEVKTAVGTSALAGLLDNPQSHQSSIAVKPGLYYGFSVGTNVDGLDANPTCVLATGTTMNVDMPAYDTVAFIKVVIKASND